MQTTMSERKDTLEGTNGRSGTVEENINFFKDFYCNIGNIQ